MAHQRLWALRRRVGQAREVDCQQQALFSQRQVVGTDTTTLRYLQTEWVCENLRRYRQK